MDADKSGLVEEEITEKVIRAFYTVYNEMGPGFLEQVYENAMAHCLRDDGLDVWQQATVDVYFRTHRVGEYRADLLIPGRLLIEVKAAVAISPSHEAQLLNYLKATGLPVGLLLNFGPHAQVKRRVNSKKKSALIRANPRKSALEA